MPFLIGMRRALANRMNAIKNPAPHAFRDTSAQDQRLNAPTRRPRWLLLAIGVLALAMLGFAVKPGLRWLNSDRSVGIESLRLSVASIGTLKRDLSVQGVVVAADSPTLYASSAGTVRFTVKPGASVARDALLAQIQSPELSNRLAQEQASLLSQQTDVSRARIANKKQALLTQRNADQARVALSAARREKQRGDAAWAKSAMSQVDFLRSADNLETAELSHQHALADQKLELESLGFELIAKQQVLERQALLVRDLERQVAALDVRSPVAGIVGNLATTERAQVALNQALLTVVDLSRLELEIGIPESSADELALSLDVRIEANGQALRGTLASISPQIVNGQALGRVRLLNSEGAGLKQNQRLSAQILLGEKAQALIIARGPALNDGGGILYVIEDGVALKRRVQVGISSVSQVEILSGLKAGDQVIVAGSDRFENAERVMVNGL